MVTLSCPVNILIFFISYINQLLFSLVSQQKTKNRTIVTYFMKKEYKMLLWDKTQKGFLCFFPPSPHVIYFLFT